jgi:hypothetical protein
MDIESEIVREYKQYMINNSIFGEILEENKTILPDTPQSFSKFPTIVIREANNTMYGMGKTLDRTEYVDNLLYQVDIYTKDVKIKIDGEIKTYAARTVINELKDLTFKFFNQIGFNRITANRGEYIDVNVNRYISVFEARLNNWNMKIL